MTSPPGIVLESVSHHLRTAAGRVHALEEISLTVAPGTSLAIVGPSGCGKSTLLGLISGLAVATTGRVLVDGVPIAALDREGRARMRRRLFGLVFQTGGLAPYLTAVENVGLQLALSGEPDDHGRCVALLTALGLADHVDKLPDQLSGGERQRVAVARALIHQPRFVLADEPTGSLDDANSSSLVDVMDTARRAAGSTLIVVTHDPSVARRMDRTLHLRDGRIVEFTLNDTAVTGG